jgi:hypothetical protein
MLHVNLPDGTAYEVKTLLADGDSNTKLRKSNAASVEYLTVSLSLSPAKESGYEACSSRSPGCTKACLFTAGYGVYSNVRRPRIAKTIAFFEQREAFKAMLFKELYSWRAKAKRQGKRLAVRLNVVSDIQWEKIFPDMFEFPAFDDVQFYDYTKHAKRMAAFELSRVHNDATFFPLNYHLTFSRSETNIKECTAVYCYKHANVAVVFDSKDYPAHYAGRPVVNGDETDLRFLDPPGCIVGLYAKGQGKKDETGFVIHLPTVS